MNQPVDQPAVRSEPDYGADARAGAGASTSASAGTGAGRHRTRRSLLWTGIALASLGLGAGVASWHYRLEQPEREAVSLLFNQDWPDADGRAYRMDAQTDARAWIINFWATWCPPCVHEMPELDGLQRELAPRGLRSIGFAIDSAAKVREFSTKSPMGYPLVIAGAAGSELMRRLGNPSGALPFTLILGRDRRPEARILGRFKLEALRTAALRALA